MLLRPDLVVDAAHHVTPELLGRHGIRGLMVDLDDTLIPSAAHELEGHHRSWFAALRDAGIPTLILSNGERQRVLRVAAELGVEGLPLVGKPFVFAFRRGLARLGTPAAETAMVGDQLFTDVLGANLAGLTSILVTPLSGGRAHTRVVRRFERMILGGGDRGRSIDR